VTKTSFGARICGATVSEILNLESDHPAATKFATLDKILSSVVHASLAGKRVAELHPATKPYETVRLSEAIDSKAAAYIAQTFSLDSQQGRGAWFVPDEASLTIGWANWPYHSDRYQQFSCGVAHRERGKVRFDGSPAAIFVWATLERLFELLYSPFMLRGPTPLGGDHDEQRNGWVRVLDAYNALGIVLDPDLCGMGFGVGWGKLRAREQLAVRHALRDAIRAAVGHDVGARYRILSTRDLVQKYYASARGGPPTMRKVITKPLQRSLAGLFGGDWLSFVAYLGETANPGEQISKTLPEPRLYVGASTRVATVAAEQGVSAEEVERMLATFWSSGGDTSPVHRRVAVLREYWDHFDGAHARQASGMNSLWGFADPAALTLAGLDTAETGPAWYHPGQYRRKLPAELLAEIERLWEGLFLRSTPGRIVTSTSPYAGMLDAFGPALRFWHGVGLTTWFLSEGPMSRTDLGGLRQYHSRDLESLAALKTPVDNGLFTELIAAEKHLGKPKPYTTSEHVSELMPGVRLSTGMTVGSKRSGFEFLRDIVTTYRRAWAAKFLDTYLRARWESEIRAASREYARHLEVKGKAPTAKQFAKFAEAPTNHWFGGDVNSLYAAFGEKAPGPTQRVKLLFNDVESFALRVFFALGGNRIDASNLTYHEEEDDAEQARRQAEWDVHWKLKQLAELSVRYAQLREAVGRQPTVLEFGREEFEHLGTALGNDQAQAWATYATTIDSCLPL
jgi:hypothetical protein